MAFAPSPSLYSGIIFLTSSLSKIAKLFFFAINSEKYDLPEAGGPKTIYAVLLLPTLLVE